MYVSAACKRTIEQALEHCQPDRRQQFEQVWDMTQQLVTLETVYQKSEIDLAQAREAAISGSTIFTVPNR
jgi:hypothetical protein